MNGALLRHARRALLALVLVALANAGCGLLLDLEPPDPVPLPPAFDGGCFEDFDRSPGVIFFAPGAGAMVSGRGRGLFVDSNSRWTFVETARTTGSVTLSVALPGGGTAEIVATSAGGTLRLSRLPGPTAELTLEGCIDTVGLYDQRTSTFSLWDAHLDDPPDPGQVVPFAPVLIDPADPPLPVTGDWDGDGVDEIGLWYPAQRAFFLGIGARRVSFPAGVLPAEPPGGTPDFLLPIAGDWNGDGNVSVGLMASETGEFFLLDRLGGSGVTRFVLGGGTPMTAGDRRPLAGDWDGDGDDTVGIFNARVGRVRLINENRAGMTETACVDPVLAGSLRPVAGSWGNIGRDRVLLYQPNAGGSLPQRDFVLVEVEAPGCRRLGSFALGPASTAADPLLPVAGNWDGR